MIPTERQVADALTIGARVRILIDLPSGPGLGPEVPKGSIAKVHNITSGVWWFQVSPYGFFRILGKNDFEFIR